MREHLHLSGSRSAPTAGRSAPRTCRSGSRERPWRHRNQLRPDEPAETHRRYVSFWSSGRGIASVATALTRELLILVPTGGPPPLLELLRKTRSSPSRAIPRARSVTVLPS